MCFHLTASSIKLYLYFHALFSLFFAGKWQWGKGCAADKLIEMQGALRLHVRIYLFPGACVCACVCVQDVYIYVNLCDNNKMRTYAGLENWLSTDVCNCASVCVYVSVCLCHVSSNLEISISEFVTFAYYENFSSPISFNFNLLLSVRFLFI